MPKDHANFHSANGLRRILVVDDEEINRGILAAVLGNDYEVLLAEDGEEAMKKVWENHDTLSLVLLDLIMPNMKGQEVLRRMKAAPELSDIPVMVASADQSQEIECLNAGATDFIQKPYPDAGVVLARVRRTIELSEDRQIIQSTERDPLTGLYNREFFYSYAEQYDLYHKDEPMDAIVIDINHFNSINERFGRAYADEVLCTVGERILELVRDEGGIVCRSGADVFLVYCPHREEYKAFLDNVGLSLSDSQDANSRIRLRMGVYSNVDKSLEIERRFDRAKTAADTVRDNYMRSIGVYDDALHTAELYAQQLIDEFPKALEQHQFVVYYQPKFAIQGKEPVLEGAEALVRWQHPERGMISPGVFIPLFEENGLIQVLDRFVWEEAARQVRAWKDSVGWCMPISVNVSRVDMYDPAIFDTLQAILDDNGIEAADLNLEVTESAYADDAKQIIEAVKRMRSMGFHIEMDDFGTGYSSLNMLATLPIDILKLDMNFIRTAFAQEGDQDTHMLKAIVDIAEHLGVPTIAEGVETEEQLTALKDLGCDVVQGYYFSAPVPPADFEHFVREGKSAHEKVSQEERAAERRNRRARTAAGEDKAHWWERMPGLSLRRVSAVFMVLGAVVAVALLAAEWSVVHSHRHMDDIYGRNMLAREAATNLEYGSDYLTENVRNFVVTGDIKFLDNYFEELNVTKRRDTAVEDLQNLLEGQESAAYDDLKAALEYSNELVEYEYKAMNLTLAAGNYDSADIPVELKEAPLNAEELALSKEQKQERARALVYGDGYDWYKNNIRQNASKCTQALVASSDEARVSAMEHMNVMLNIQTALTVALLLLVVGLIVFVLSWVRLPLESMVEMMQKDSAVPVAGALELRFVSTTYNAIFEENRKKLDRLNYGFMHDALTGCYNRKAYETMQREMDMTNTALLLVDVDRFKLINDTYGHDVGDLVLKRVAEVLEYSFRSSDLVFRVGGDEFVVIMTNVTSAIREQVMRKIEQANLMLQKPADDLPQTSLSVGAAFADRENPEGDIFKDADTALYRMKQGGRCGCVIY